MTISSTSKYKKRFNRLDKSCKEVDLFIYQSNLFKEYLRLISYSSQKFSVPQEIVNLIRSRIRYMKDRQVELNKRCYLISQRNLIAAKAVKFYIYKRNDLHSIK